MKKTSLIILAALVSLVWGCGGDDPEEPVAPTDGAITVVADRLAYEPAEITIAVAEEVTLTLSNTDNIEHDFQIDDIDADISSGGVSDGDHGNEHDGDAALAVHSDAGEDRSITFVANEAGEYEFYCTVPGHRESGMVGTLTVTP